MEDLEGAENEMSADVWLEVDTGGAELTDLDSTHENVTYNLTPMLREAGFPGHKALIGAPATEAGGVYRRTADRLRAEPERFRPLNPENGWGDYEGAIAFCDRMAAHCAHHPKTVIGGWL